MWASAAAALPLLLATAFGSPAPAPALIPRVIAPSHGQVRPHRARVFGDDKSRVHDTPRDTMSAKDIRSIMLSSLDSELDGMVDDIALEAAIGHEWGQLSSHCRNEMELDPGTNVTWIMCMPAESGAKATLRKLRERLGGRVRTIHNSKSTSKVCALAHASPADLSDLGKAELDHLLPLPRALKQHHSLVQYSEGEAAKAYAKELRRARRVARGLPADECSGRSGDALCARQAEHDKVCAEALKESGDEALSAIKGCLETVAEAHLPENETVAFHSLPKGTMRFNKDIFGGHRAGLVVEVWPSEYESGKEMGERWLRDVHAMHTGSPDDLRERDAHERRLLGVRTPADEAKPSDCDTHGSVRAAKQTRSRLEALAAHDGPDAQCHFDSMTVDEVKWGKRSGKLQGATDKARFVVLEAAHTVADVQGTEPAVSDEVRTACTLRLLTYLEAQPDVLVVVPHTDQFEIKNEDANWILQSAVDANLPYFAKGIDGDGQVIGCSDTGLDEYSCFFFDNDEDDVVDRSPSTASTHDPTRRKVVQYIDFVDEYDYTSGHGTHVAGSAVGSVYSGNADENTAGIGTEEGTAPAAKMAFFDGGNNAGGLAFPNDIGAEMFDPAKEAGARIHTNSWGVSCRGNGGAGCSYLSYDLQIDDYLYDNSDFLIMYAAGNDGDYGTYTVGSPGHSKNGMTIGCTEGFTGDDDLSVTIGYLADFSSIGPSYDLRYKPDVVSPGKFLLSANAVGYEDTETCTTTYKAGTSMATPALAGMGALLRQYFEDGFYGSLYTDKFDCDLYECDAFEPSGMLIKALYVNGGNSLTAWNAAGEFGFTELGTAPDIAQGFGRFQMTRTAPLTENGGLNLFVADSQTIGSYETLNWTFAITNESFPFQATITWYDPPNSVSAADQLLHDLDLVVYDNNGETVYSNGRDEDDGGDDSLDFRNNVEKVLVEAPSEGTVYRVCVSANLLTEDDEQEFALAISGGGFAYTPTPSPVPGVPVVGPNRDDDGGSDDDDDSSGSSSGEDGETDGGAVAGSIIGVGAVLILAAFCWKQQKDGNDPMGKTKGVFVTAMAAMGGSGRAGAGAGDIPTGTAYPASTRWTTNPTTEMAPAPGGAAPPAKAPRKPPALPPRKPGRGPPQLKENEYECKFAHVAEDADEMGMEKGDIITVIATDESGWWQGTNNKTGVTGIFPAVYLVPKEDAGAIVAAPGSEESNAV